MGSPSPRQGSIATGANINCDTGHAVFEATHGTAEFANEIIKWIKHASLG